MTHDLSGHFLRATLLPRARRLMAQFDPRAQGSRRYLPRLVIGGVLCATLIAGWRLTGHEAAVAQEAPPWQRSASAEANLQRVTVEVQPGETLDAAVTRLGLSPEDGQALIAALAQGIDVINVKAGLSFDVALARPDATSPYARLVSLSLRTGPTELLTLARGGDGALSLRRVEEPTRTLTTVAQGSMEGSLYEAALRAGATPQLTSEAAKLFSSKIDFSRDIQPQDRFRLVFDRKVTAAGRAVDEGELLYAEIGLNGVASRFYRYQPLTSSEPQFYDANGRNVRGFLLHTPVEAARITSGFGMRMHPILGYTRMHQGIDFGAPIGTPVLAAGDGVVSKAQWDSGYGRWLEIRHSGGWSTGYGHLSGWAVKPGEMVHQGQLVAYVGNTGQSTGPHLHYEIIKDGIKINPQSARAPEGSSLDGRELAAFHMQKARIDALLAARALQPGMQLASAISASPARTGGLRMALR